jgi:hypothetical protein
VARQLTEEPADPLQVDLLELCGEPRAAVTVEAVEGVGQVLLARGDEALAEG